MDNINQRAVRTLGFLDVPDDGRADFPVKNPGKERRWPAVQGVVRAVGKMSAVTKKRLGISRDSGTGIPRNLSSLNTRYRKRPELPPELRATLEHYFEEDVLLLSRVLGRDLENWRGDGHEAGGST